MGCSFYNPLQKIFGPFKTMNLKNIYIQIYETFTLPRLTFKQTFCRLASSAKN